jgi:hypothetical protein
MSQTEGDHFPSLQQLFQNPWRDWAAENALDLRQQTLAVGHEAGLTGTKQLK